MSISTSSSAIPSLGKPELEYLAEEQMKAFARFNGKDDTNFKVWKFAAYFLRKKVSFEWLSNDGCILGLSSFVDGTSIPVYDPEADTVRRRELEGDTILLSKDMEHPFMSLSKPRFTLMHECAHYHLLRSHSIDLILSGHAHGGQWRFYNPIKREWVGVWSPGQGFLPRLTSGVHEGRLVISRGLSNTTVIPRICNPTEIVYIN